jgi:hypothetical protein
VGVAKFFLLPEISTIKLENYSLQPKNFAKKFSVRRSQFVSTWWFTREEIGRGLRERYQVPKELSPKLLELVRKLDAVSSSRTLVSKLDAIEGNYLLRYAPPVEPRSVGPSDDWSVCT